ncbi:MAG TPA: hypothetical protein VF134_04875 [Candidatus Dormibacteraeota bacterium]
MSSTRLDVSAQSHNMQLLGHLDLDGHGNGGEGISLHSSGGRRTLYIAHESAPVNFSVIDVTDPREPRMIAQTRLPHDDVRSNSLHVAGDLMAVAYQTKAPGGQPAGVELFDISRPGEPRSAGFFDASGPHSRGTHCLWFVDGETVWASTGLADFEPADPKDDQIVVALDVRDPSHPREAGRWWLPGTRKGDREPPPPRHPRFDFGYRSHNINVYPRRPDRAYVAYLDGGVVILDIGDRSDIRQVSRLDYHPPLPGFTHTALPLFERGLLAVTDESVLDAAEDHPKHLWLMDASVETNVVPIATAPLPPPEFRTRGGRYGTHNLHENEPVPTAYQSETTLVGAFFNAGVRAFDIRDHFQPRLSGYFVPEAPPGSRAGAIQINDVYADERGLIYAIDRFSGGLYILEFEAWA